MIPKKIPINREEGYHTRHVGTFSDGQYMGFSFFLETKQNHLVSVLHLFDKAGAHIQTKTWDSGTNAEIEKSLVSAIRELPNQKAGNIAIQLFTVNALGQEFGLVKIDERRVDYVPYGLAFFAPWNGNYDT